MWNKHHVIASERIPLLCVQMAVTEQCPSLCFKFLKWNCTLQEVERGLGWGGWGMGVVRGWTTMTPSGSHNCAGVKKKRGEKVNHYHTDHDAFAAPIFHTSSYNLMRLWAFRTAPKRILKLPETHNWVLEQAHSLQMLSLVIPSGQKHLPNEQNITQRLKIGF